MNDPTPIVFMKKSFCRGSPTVMILVLLISVLEFFGCKKDAQQPSNSARAPSSVSPENANLFSSFDSFNEALAKRVTDRITGKPIPDFLVLALQGGAYPVGTLLRQNQFIPVAASACQPLENDKEVISTSAPTLFPTYSMTRKVAGSIGLDESVFNGLAQVGLSAVQDSSVNLSISETALDVWTDSGVRAGLSSDSCRKVLEPSITYRLIRGLVKGKREFVFGLNRAAKAGVTVSKIANFNAEVSGDGSTMKISDTKPETFVIVVSEVTVPPTKTEQIKLTAPSTPPTPTSGGKVYVQQDSSDNPANGKKIVELLKEQKLNVASLVEKIPTSKMPSSTQVRYFRAEDESKAEEVLRTLKKEYPEAKLVALRVPAPAGQLEVWLPRTRN